MCTHFVAASHYFGKTSKRFLVPSCSSKKANSCGQGNNFGSGSAQMTTSGVFLSSSSSDIWTTFHTCAYLGSIPFSVHSCRVMSSAIVKYGNSTVRKIIFLSSDYKIIPSLSMYVCVVVVWMRILWVGLKSVCLKRESVKYTPCLQCTIVSYVYIFGVMYGHVHTHKHNLNQFFRQISI